MKNNIVITAIIGVLVGIGGFFAGSKYQQSKTPVNRFANFQGTRNGSQQGRGGFRPVNGEILSVDDKSVTVKLQDGSSKIVLLTDTTSFSKSTEGSKSKLKEGERIAAFGTDNSDGSVTAQSIQLNPLFRAGQGPAPTGR